MAIDTYGKRRLAMNAGLVGVDYLFPPPDTSGDLGKLLLLHGYYLFADVVDMPRHSLAIAKLWPAKGLLNNE